MGTLELVKYGVLLEQVSKLLCNVHCQDSTREIIVTIYAKEAVD
jgi:hypothetical protein